MCIALSLAYLVSVREGRREPLLHAYMWVRRGFAGRGVWWTAGG